MTDPCLEGQEQGKTVTTEWDRRCLGTRIVPRLPLPYSLSLNHSPACLHLPAGSPRKHPPAPGRHHPQLEYFVLAEMIKSSTVDIEALVFFIQANNVSPNWMQMQLPHVAI